MVELSTMEPAASPAEVEAQIEKMFKGQPKVQSCVSITCMRCMG